MQKQDCEGCRGTLGGAMVLPCGHIFCKECLEELLDPHKCPLCSKRFESIRLVAPNLSLLKYKQDNEEHSCSNCMEENAQIWCENCASGTNYCAQCDKEVHSANALKKHTRVSLKEKPDRLTFPKCSKHNKENEVYCVKCEVFSCLDCIIEEHQFHQIQNAQWYENERKKLLSSSVECLKDELFYVQRKSEKCLKQYEKKVIKMKEKMEECTERLRLIKQQRQKFETIQTALNKSIQGLGIVDFVDEQNEMLITQKIEEVLENVVNEIDSKILKNEEKELEKEEKERLDKKKARLKKLETQISKIEKSRQKRRDKEKQDKRKILTEHIKKELSQTQSKPTPHHKKPKETNNKPSKTNTNTKTPKKRRT